MNNQLLQKVYIENAPKLKAMCYRYVGDAQLAEDLVHDAFLQAINKLDTLKSFTNVEAWMRRITVTTVLMYLRSSKNIASKGIAFLDVADHDVDDDELMDHDKKEIIEAQFTHDELVQSVNLLPEHHKMVFNMYVFERYNHREIGQILSISPGTSKSHLARARKKLKLILVDMAKNKKLTNEKKSKLQRMIAFVFFPGEDFITSLYRSKAANSSMPIASQNFMQTITTGQHAVNHLVIGKLIVSKTAMIIGAASITVASALITTVAIKNSDDGNLQETPSSVETNFINIQQDDSLAIIDSSTNSNLPVNQVVESDNNENDSIVKKTVILHKTVFLDTTETNQ